eukprot:gene20163-30997_t
MKTWDEYYPEDQASGFDFKSAPPEEFRKYFYPVPGKTDTGGKQVSIPLKKDQDVRSVDWNADGTYCAVGTRDGQLVVFETSRVLDHTKVRQRVNPYLEVKASDERRPAECSNVRWHPEDCNIVATICGESLRVWDIRLRPPDVCVKQAGIKLADGKSAGEGLNMRWHPTGDYIFVSTSADWMGIYLLGSAETRKLERVAMNKFHYVVNEFEIAPDGSTLIAGNEWGAVDMFNVSAKHGASLAVQPQHKKAALQCNSSSVFAIDVEPLGRYFAVGSADSVVSFLTLRTHETMGCFTLCRDEIRSITFTADGEMTCV